jgi:hypothetical protein
VATPRSGRRSTRRRAISAATGAGHRLGGSAVIIWAKLLAACGFASLAKCSAWVPRIRTVSGQSRENGQGHTIRLNANLGEQEPIEVGARKDPGIRMRHDSVPDLGVPWIRPIWVSDASADTKHIVKGRWAPRVASTEKQKGAAEATITCARSWLRAVGRVISPQIEMPIGTRLGEFCRNAAVKAKRPPHHGPLKRVDGDSMTCSPLNGYGRRGSSSRP